MEATKTDARISDQPDNVRKIFYYGPADGWGELSGPHSYSEALCEAREAAIENEEDYVVTQAVTRVRFIQPKPTTSVESV